LLIVDNNSNDNTWPVVEQFMAQHPETRYVFEPQLGLSHARNTGIRESHGDIIAFVDDDVFFDPRWLMEVIKIFRDYPEASCMGGKSIPQFEGGRPDWITDNFLHMFGSTNSGDLAKWMIYPEFPYGLNMAFKRVVFQQIGLFNVNLGRKKKNLLSDEEKDIFWRINQTGLKVIYAPNALLYHRIPAERTNQEWVLGRYYWQGISDVAFKQTTAPLSRFTLLREALRVGWQTIRRSTGNKLSPRKAYWHYVAAKFSERAYQAFQWGRVRRMIQEALRF
jgi:GT2 family glycosyltransferase